MATSALQSKFESSTFRYDDFFFSGMAVIILATVFVGFAHSYYLAGVFQAPLPNVLVHIHGAVFTSWIVLLITQTSLVAGRRVDLHRRLGLIGFAVACLMVVLGVMVATDSMARHFAAGNIGISQKAFYAVPIADMGAFATLIYFGFRERFHPAAHKRLMLIATIVITDAAFVRWPNSSRVVESPDSPDMLLRATVLAGWIRSMFNKKDSSRHALGHLVCRRPDANADAHRAHGALAAFCHMGAESSPFFPLSTKN